MLTKLCTKCKIEKSLNEFQMNKARTDGKQSSCRNCRSIHNKKYREENSEKVKIRHKKYRETHKAKSKKYRDENKDKRKIYIKKYNQEHKEERKKYYDKYRNNHKEEIRNYWKKYNKDNIEKITINRNTYNKQKCKTDIRFKITNNLRARICGVLKGNNKSLSTMMLIGCEIDYLLYHLQSQFTKGMSWDNHGKWHIDHIRPCASFDLSKPEEQRKCFNYKNLQPLWAKDNLAKSDKWSLK